VGLFSQQFIDDLRLQANIVQVVQEYVPLKRAGTTFKGLCPFHSEKTPSFHVNPEKAYFHCFGCGAGGDVFKFLVLHESLGFQDAVRTLAQKFGVPLPEQSEGGGSADDTVAVRKFPLAGFQQLFSRNDRQYFGLRRILHGHWPAHDNNLMPRRECRYRQRSPHPPAGRVRQIPDWVQILARGAGSNQDACHGYVL